MWYTHVMPSFKACLDNLMEVCSLGVREVQGSIIPNTL